MTVKKRILTLLTAVLCLSGIIYRAAPVRALDESQKEEPLAETIFLGETVPLRLESRDGVGLEEAVRAVYFPGQAGELELFWISPDGPQLLSALAKQRPKSSTVYKLTAILHNEEGDIRRNMDYRIQIVSGSLRISVDGPGAVAGASVLFRLEGRNLTLYAQAAIDPDPLGGGPVLLAEFSGLPYGQYTVAAVSGRLAPEEAVCWLGTCPDNDTVHPDRRSAVLRFSLDSAGGEAAGESYLLRNRP